MFNNVQSLVQQLASGEPAKQAAAAESLARMGNDAQPAAAALVSVIRAADAPTLEWCAAALEDLGPPPASQIGEHTRLAGDKSLDAAYWAITLLGRAGNEASPAISTLTGILNTSPEPALRERTAWALGKIGPAAKSASPALREAAAADDPRLARLAQQALGEIEL